MSLLQWVWIIKKKIKIKDEIEEIEDYLEFKLAMIFRNKHENNIPENSTLNKKQSNIFGQFNYKPADNIKLNYDFSIDNDLNTFEYNSITTKIDFDNFSTQINFLEEAGLISQSNIIENISTYNFNEENILSFGIRRNRKTKKNKI